MILNKTASAPDAYLRPSFFYRTARDGMRDFLTNALQSERDGVLLPAFIGWSQREGSGVFDPVLDSKARVGFYDLNSDLSVQMENVERQLASGLYRVVVVIHYFGRTEREIDKIRQLADVYDVVLVEDLAHGFFSSLGKGKAGRFGQVSLFSLHKMFPFSQGGMIRYSDSSLVRDQTSTMVGLAEQMVSYDWRAISKARRDNFMALTRLLLALPEYGSKFDLLWPDLDENDVPQTLPVRILSGNRDKIYSEMNSDGFGMVSLYHTLIEPVRHDFFGLNRLSKQITNFPVHQDVTVNSIPDMVSSFRKHLNTN